MSILSRIQSVFVYAPIPLFAENLRVQKALVSTILTQHSISPCLTGCIKDLSLLWNIDDYDLLGKIGGGPTAVATSVRHGSVFQLSNQSILDACQITNRKSAKIFEDYKEYRETVVNISFITPGEDVPTESSNWKIILIVVAETLVIIGAAIGMGFLGMVVGPGLMVCVVLSNIILSFLRETVRPIFGNRAKLEKDRNLTARKGASLDVHVVAENWNSSRLDILMGFSSQLHSLTNVPVRVNKLNYLRWGCRFLAIVLSFQAALLASLTNIEGIDRWSGMVWLVVYGSMGLLKQIWHHFQGPEDILQRQPGKVQQVESLHFAGRRAAMVFITLLPVSNKDRFAWWDVFIPNDERRRAFQRELESFDAFTKNAENPERTRIAEDPEKKGSPPAGNTPPRFNDTQRILKEALNAFGNESLQNALKTYQETMFPPVVVPVARGV